MADNILVINPGSTSEDIGYYRGDNAVFEVTLRYSPAELAAYADLSLKEQLPLRKKFILETLKKYNVNLSEIDAIIGRGGFLRPIEGGVYEVNEVMVNRLLSQDIGNHPSNLGGLLANEIAAMSKHAKSFIADPVVVDELQPLARYTGVPEIERKSIFHALNQKRVARLAAKELGIQYSQANFIVMHGGGGITIGAHKEGKVIDVNNAYSGAGPMTPQRSGVLPAADLIEMCTSGRYTRAQMRSKLRSKGGLLAYTGTSDVKALLDYVKDGSQPDDFPIEMPREKVKQLIDAMIYGVVKEIGAMAVVLRGKVDAIILTGGLSNSDYIVKEIKGYTSFLTKHFFVYKGGDEKAALRQSALEALERPEIIKNYK